MALHRELERAARTADMETARPAPAAQLSVRAAAERALGTGPRGLGRGLRPPSAPRLPPLAEARKGQ